MSQELMHIISLGSKMYPPVVVICLSVCTQSFAIIVAKKAYMEDIYLYAHIYSSYLYM